MCLNSRILLMTAALLPRLAFTAFGDPEPAGWQLRLVWDVARLLPWGW